MGDNLRIMYDLVNIDLQRLNDWLKSNQLSTKSL